MTRRLIAALIFVGALSGPASAAPDGWVLALSWQPGFCATNVRAPECRMSSAPRLTLHGLWPEGEAQEFCGVSAPARDLDANRQWCDLPEPRVSQETRAALVRVMPGTAACLERHEWTRHGSCADLPAEQYYSRAIALTETANRLELAGMLRAANGGTITIAQVRESAARDFGTDGARTVTAVCAGRGAQLHLVELRISLAADGLERFPDRTALNMAGKATGRHCPENRPVRVDGP